jgi:GTPase
MTEEKSLKREVCVIMAGSADSGKSTTIGVLESGVLDDGNGSARVSVAIHPHEKQFRMTSDISTVNITSKHGKQLMLVDLCGQDIYLRTTLFGITAYRPEYAILVIAANKGFRTMTREHLGILLCLQIPIIILITRADLSPENIYNKTVQSIKNYLKQYQRQPRFLNDLKSLALTPKELIDVEAQVVPEAIATVKLMADNPKIVPVITISNKTGFFLDVFKTMLDSLVPRDTCIVKKGEPAVFNIFRPFWKKGIGLVLHGVCQGSPIHKNDELLLGPYGKEWIPIRIWSMHDNDEHDIELLNHGHRGCLAFKVTDKKFAIEKKDIKKGMVVISRNTDVDRVCYQFKAKITILNHSTTISNKYSPVIHTSVVRQTARIRLDPNVHLKTNDQAEVTFRFVQRPEYLTVGEDLFFKEGTTRGHGIITSILPLSEDPDSKPAMEFKKQRGVPRKLGYKNKTKKKIHTGAPVSTVSATT